MSPAIKIDLPRTQRNLLRAVASFEVIKGLFVLLIGFSAILLVHKDAWVIAESLLAVLHISTDRHSAQVFLDFADNLTDARLWAAAQLAFTYSVLRFAEGYGLWKQRTWAEWLAFGSGTLLLPIEIRALRPDCQVAYPSFASPTATYKPTPRPGLHQARETLAQLRFRLGRADGIVIVAQAKAGDYANCDEAGSFGPDAVQYRPLGVDHFGRFGCRAASFVATCLLSLMYDLVRQCGRFRPLGTRALVVDFDVVLIGRHSDFSIHIDDVIAVSGSTVTVDPLASIFARCSFCV